MAEIKMTEVERLQRRVARERAARKEAEQLLENKSLELYVANDYLALSHEQLENRVAERTQALQQSEELFRNFIEAATDIIYQTTPEGFFTYANPVAIRKLGLTEESEVIGHHFLELVHSEDKEMMTTFYSQQLLEGEKNTYLEFRLNTLGVEEVWIGQNVQMILNGENVVGFQAVARDISDRKRVERELEEQRDFAQQILSNMGQGLTLTDSNYRFIYSNQSFSKIVGYSPDELLNKTPYELVHPEDLTKLIEVHQQRGLQNSQEYEVDLRMIAKDGREVPVLISGTMRMSIGDSERAGSIVVITDLTEQKQMHETLREARDQAINASRMKSEFLANMSHEIRTPLNGIIGMADLLDETQLDEEQEEFVEIINTSSVALLSIINDVLDFSKITEGKIELEYMPFNLREMIEEALDVLAAKAIKKGVELAYIMPSEIPSHIVGDIVRVRQVLINLLSNAVKFTEQGEVVVSVESNFHKDGRNQLQISVRDTGIGISEEGIKRLFKSFSQVDASTTRSHGGTGLGLAISKELSELMGGTMWVESVVGEGSTFHFTIDLALAPDHIAINQFQPAELEGKRILIVDDNATNRRILTSQARSWGMVPEAASSGLDALNQLENNHTYDLAILDMKMPIMDGYMLALEIRKRPDLANLPLIMLSSLGHKVPESDRDLFSAQISKPIKVNSLRQVVQSVCLNFLTADFEAKPKRKAKSLSLVDEIPRILLVEDNCVNQKVALGSLRHLNYSADLAINGREAVEAMQKQNYDVILMDIQMPEMNGIEATQHIRKNCLDSKQPYIIAMTANAVKGDKERFLAAGMDAYLSKPFRLNELGEMLEPLMAVAQTE